MTPIELDLRPPGADEKKLFYSAPTDAGDEALATVGHLRADFGSSGKDFQSSWNPHNGDRFNTPEFKATLRELVDSLRENGPLKSLSAMRKYCAERGEKAKLEDQGAYGFIADTEDLNYRFALRFTPSPGQYHLYLYAYDMSRQRAYGNASTDFACTRRGKPRWGGIRRIFADSRWIWPLSGNWIIRLTATAMKRTLTVRFRKRKKAVRLRK